VTASILTGRAWVLESERAVFNISQAAFVVDSTLLLSALADWATGTSGSSPLSTALSDAGWAGGEACCVCARLTAPARHKMQIKTANLFMMPYLFHFLFGKVLP
jgi:hypothetical protein